MLQKSDDKLENDQMKKYELATKLERLNGAKRRLYSRKRAKEKPCLLEKSA